MKEDKTKREVRSTYGDNIQDMYCSECHKITTFTEWLNRPGGYLSGIVCNSCGSERQQKKPSYYDCHVYRETCSCGHEQIITTQDDNRPEYYSIVGVPCPKCKKLILFELPVN